MKRVLHVTTVTVKTEERRNYEHNKVSLMGPAAMSRWCNRKIDELVLVRAIDQLAVQPFAEPREEFGFDAFWHW